MRFLKAGLVVALVLGAVASSAAPRSYTAGRFALFVDGEAAGFDAVGGGAVEGLRTPTKAASAVRGRAPLTLQVSGPLDRSLFGWLQGSVAGKRPARTVHVAQLGGRSVDFANAMISEIGFPALDGSSKDAAKLKLTIVAEQLRFHPASRKLVRPPKPKAKKWLSSAFEFEIAGLPGKQVTKVDAFTIKQKIVRDRMGKFREPTKHPTKLEVPNIKITLNAAAEPALRKWYAAKSARTARLALTDAAGRPWLRVVMSGVKLRSLGSVKGRPVATVSVRKVVLRR